MNAVTDIADLDAEPLDESIGRVEARVRGVARAGEVGLVLLEVVEALALRAAQMVNEQAEDEGLDLKVVAAVSDLAQAYGKVSRAIRQNALLEDRLETGLRDRVSGLEDARRALARRPRRPRPRRTRRRSFSGFMAPGWRARRWLSR